ncbi:hypothetical protein F2Q69_00043391 [Brassica cretica]|uniref:RNase H type-1 domain-containing protein n=2 Tax=Brassica TaxID=3705 RepID=A0A8S9NJW5_BRACR|nr:hypothetical protein F2Q69_00043391 [Brassica cretica]
MPNHTIQENSLEKAKDSNEVIRNIDGFCCFVDASWTSSEEKAGIGWALYNKDAKLVLHGKAAIEPIGSPLEADAEALHMAISQIKRVGFHPVTFCGGSAMLYKQLPQHKELIPMVPKPMSLSCPTYIEYIDNLIKEGKASFSFQKVPRSCNTQADNLAREGRMKNLNYVVCWNLYKTRPI